MGLLKNFQHLASLMAPQPVANTGGALESVAVPAVPDLPPTRETALSLPPLLRARNLICTTAAGCELVTDSATDNPLKFLTRADGELSPWHRMLWTADDLLFYGWSLWEVTRDFDGRVLTGTRVGFHRWDFDQQGRVTIDGENVPADSVILFPGIHEGILSHGGLTIRQAAALMRGVTRSVETPNPVTELHQTNDRPMSQEESDALKAKWIAARQAPGGGVAVTSAGIEVRSHGAASEHLLIEGRNAVATDIARLCGIPSPMIDASIGGTSLSYSNSASRLSELIAFGVAPIITAIAARLSQNDVTPRGVRIDVDVTGAVTGLTVTPAPDGLVDLHPSTTPQGANN